MSVCFKLKLRFFFQIDEGRKHLNYSPLLKVLLYSYELSKTF